jgi:hypothetical protein
MRDRMIEQPQWPFYFEFVSKYLEGCQVEVEVDDLARDLSDQVQEEAWIALEGLSYDPLADVFFIHGTQINRQITRPREIFVIEDGALLRAIGLKDADGRVQMVRLRQPLMLEQPKHAV